MIRRLLPGGARRRVAGLLLGFALLATSCGTANPTAVPQAATGPPAGATTLSIADTAAALLAPGQATKGAWSVLAHLQISVFDMDGRELLHGSQPFADNSLYLYGFEVELVGRLTSNGSDSWDQLAAKLSAWDPTISIPASSLQAAISGYYTRHADDYAGQLLKAMNVDLTGSAALSSFVEWLLIADPLILHPDQVIPAIGVADHTAGTVSLMVDRVATLGATSAQLIQVVHDLDLTGILVYSVVPSGPEDLRMGTHGPGDSRRFLVVAQLIKPKGAFGVPKLGVLKNYGCVLNVTYGPATGGSFTYTTDKLTKYGTFMPPPASTGPIAKGSLGPADSTGSAPPLQYQTNQDPGQGNGKAQTDQGVILFKVSLHDPVSCASNQQLQRVRVLTGVKAVDVNIHYHLPDYMIKVVETISCGTVSGTVNVMGELKGTFDDPNSLGGTATFTATGTSGGTTTLSGQLINNGQQLSFVVGPIGAFRGVTAGGMGPYAVPAEGGTVTQAVRCGTVSATATPAT